MDNTETDSDSSSIEIDISDDESDPETDFNLVLTDDTTLSPNLFKEITKKKTTADSSDLDVYKQKKLKSPELFVPSAVDVSETVEDLCSPKVIRSVRVNTPSRFREEPSKKTVITPG